MGLFKPAWMGKNPDKAKRAIDGISDPQQLLSIAVETTMPECAEYAIGKIGDDKMLFAIASNTTLPPIVRKSAIDGLSDPLLYEFVRLSTAGINKNGEQQHAFMRIQSDDYLRRLMEEKYLNVAEQDHIEEKLGEETMFAAAMKRDSRCAQQWHSRITRQDLIEKLCLAQANDSYSEAYFDEELFDKLRDAEVRQVLVAEWLIHHPYVDTTRDWQSPHAKAKSRLRDEREWKRVCEAEEQYLRDAADEIDDIDYLIEKMRATDDLSLLKRCLDSKSVNREGRDAVPSDVWEKFACLDDPDRRLNPYEVVMLEEGLRNRAIIREFNDPERAGGLIDVLASSVSGCPVSRRALRALAENETQLKNIDALETSMREAYKAELGGTRTYDWTGTTDEQRSGIYQRLADRYFPDGLPDNLK